MNLIERYIFRRTLLFSLSAFASLILVVWVVQALQRIDIVKTSASAGGAVLWIALMMIPDLATGIFPFAVLIGAVHALNRLNTDSERAVIAAAGASSRVIVKPILAVGLVAALVTILNANIVSPVAQGAFKRGLRDINTEAITLFLQPGRFEEIQKGLVVNISEARGPVIRQLFLSDQRDPAVDLAYIAKEARIVDRDEEKFLVLYDGQFQRRTNADGAVSVVQFQTYAFDLANLRPAASPYWMSSSERSTAELIHPDPNDVVYQKAPAVFAQELVQRLTDWLYPLALALWAFVVAGHPRTNRQGTGPGMTVGLLGALGLKALSIYTLSLAGIDLRLQAVGYALPILAVAFNILLIARHVSVSQLFVVERAGEWLHGLGTALRRLPGVRVAAGPAR